MTELDEIVRASLRAQVLDAPPMNAPADRAIAAAGKVRRRNAITAVCAAVVVLAMAGGGVAAIRDGALGHHPVPPATQSPTGTPSPTPTTTPSPVPTSAKLDLLVGTNPTMNLVTAAGQTIPLTGLTVGQADTVVGGWLITTPTSLWLVTADGTKRELLQPFDGVAVAPDRVHLAWRANNRLYVGHLSDTTLQPDQSTPAPQRGFPIAYTGSAVVLGYSMTGGGIDQHDVWVPSRGAYAPSWDKTQDVLSVFQPAPDGTLYGIANVQPPTKNSCLAVFDPLDSLKVIRTACGPAVTTVGDGLVSPDGRWLAAFSPMDSQFGTILVRLDTLFTNPVVSQSWTAGVPAGWLDATTLVLRADPSRLMLAHVGEATATPISGLPTDIAQVIQ